MTKAPLATFDKSLTQSSKVGLTGPGPFQYLWLPLLLTTNVTSLKDNVYMSSRTVCHKMINWSAMATRNNFDAIATSRLKRSRFTQKANQGLRGLHCFSMVYEKCTIYFDPYSLVLIIFGLLFIELNLISNISLIVTNICIYVCESTWASQAQVGPLCEVKILAVWGLNTSIYSHLQ